MSSFDEMLNKLQENLRADVPWLLNGNANGGLRIKIQHASVRYIKAGKYTGAQDELPKCHTFTTHICH